MFKHARLLSVAALILLVNSLGPLAQDNTNFVWLEEIIGTQMSQQNVPGLAIALVQGDEVIYRGGFGVRSTETQEAVTPDTLFHIGSTTKPLTAIGVLQLVDAGVLDLDEPVVTYLPEFAVDDAITLRHLLSHTAGLNDEANSRGSLAPEALQQAVLAFGPAAQFAPVGEVRAYSNVGFNIAGAVTEAAVDTPYADYMAQVFNQLKMKRTTFDPTLAMTYPLAVGYQPGLLGNTIVRPMSANTAEAPSGILYSTVDDLARLVEFFLNEGVVDGTAIISPELFAAMTTPSAVRVGTAFAYGLGVFVDTYRETVTWGHDGKIDGYTAVLRTWPAYDLGVVLLASSIAFDGSAVEDAIAETLLGLPAPEAPAAVEAPDDLTPYLGTYVISNPQGEPVFEVTISLNEAGLKAQITGQPPLELRASAPDTFEAYFAGNPVGAQVLFLRDDAGNVRYISAGLRVGIRQS
jgi:CubicO group peptidase (beta-lactamase class C family)